MTTGRTGRDKYQLCFKQQKMRKLYQIIIWFYQSKQTLPMTIFWLKLVLSKNCLWNHHWWDLCILSKLSQSYIFFEFFLSYNHIVNINYRTEVSVLLRRWRPTEVWEPDLDKQGFPRRRTLFIACYVFKVNLSAFLFIYWPQILHVLFYFDTHLV